MKPILASMIAGTALLTTLAEAQLQQSIVVGRGTRVLDRWGLTPPKAAPRSTELPASTGRSLWVYVITGGSEFGIVDLGSGAFLPVGPGLPADVGTGLIPGPGRSLLSLGFTGNLDAIDPFTGITSTVGATGLRDCSMGSNESNCPNVIGRLDGAFYATDFGNNLYSVDHVTGATKLIGPTGIPPINFVPFSENPDGSVNVYTENLFSAHGKLYANFATVAVNFATWNFKPLIPGTLYQIDPKTGHARWIARTDDNLTGVVNVNDTIYAFDVPSGKVVMLDLTNGQTTPVSKLDEAAGVIVGATSARPAQAAGH